MSFTEDEPLNEEQGPPSPFCPLPLSPLLLFLSTHRSPFLSCIPLACSHSPLSLVPNWPSCPSAPPPFPQLPALPKMRNPTTIQVTGQEKEQAAFTMDQWRPVKQSFPFSPPAILCCWQNWKRQTFGEEAEEGANSLGQQPVQPVRNLPLFQLPEGP